MKYLHSALWDGFRKTEGDTTKFDGDRFEGLVRALLNVHFPGRWIATPRTRDGGKDVVDRSIPGDTAWAECKMYRAPVSLQVVSNTLVMAVIESEVKRIFFFSYSEMIENAKAYLGKFASQTGKTVQVFDNELLEELIVSAPDLMRRYFPSALVPVNPRVVPMLPAIRSHFSSDVYVSQQQLRFIDGREKSRQHRVPIGTPCLYEIGLIARHASGTLRLRIEHEPFAPFTVLNESRVVGIGDIELAGGQMLCLPIYLAPRSSGLLTIPSLNLFVDDKPYLSLPPLEVAVSTLVHPVLVGPSVLAALHDFEIAISSGDLIRMFSVHGKSGVGKSRYLDEATALLLKNGFDLHHFDGARTGNDTIDRFIKRLLCSLWRLPDPLVIGHKGDNVSSSEDLEAESYSTVCDMVYNWKRDQFALAEDEVLAALCHGLASHRAALVIDNVQAFHPDIVVLLQRLCATVVATPGQAAIILAFNEDELLFNDAARDWLRVLRQPQGDAVRTVSLPELSPANAELFLDSLFARFAGDQTFSQAYPELVKTILAHILPRPLDLFQFIKGLEDRGAIRALSSTFTIVDFEVFHASLTSFTGIADREELFDWRMRALNVVADAKTMIAAVTYLSALSPFEIQELGIRETSYDALIDASILRWDGRGLVDFYHPSFARYFVEDTVRGRTLGAAVKQDLARRMATRRHRLGPSAEWFGIGYDVRADIESDLAVTAAQFIDQDFSGVAQNHLVADRFLKYLRERASPDTWWPWLSAVAGAAHIASQGSPRALPTRADYLLDAAKTIATLCPPSEQILNDWTHIIRETAGYVASSKEDSAGADRLLVVSLRTLDTSAAAVVGNSTRQARAQLLNRRCVTLKNLGQREAALAAANTSRTIAAAEGMYGLVCLNWIDMGYVEYGLQSRNAQLRQYWEAACTEFAVRQLGASADVRNIAVVVKLIAAKLAALTGQFRSGVEEIDALILDCRARCDSFYLLQSLATKGTLMLREALLAPADLQIDWVRVLDVARMLEDLAGSMDQAHRYRTALYLQGKVHEAQGDVARALVDYNRAASVRRNKSFDPERDALQYDIARLNGTSSASPALTTFAVGSIQLPLP